MNNSLYNLDEVDEYFKFQAGGNVYKFKHLSSDELKEFKDLGNDQDKLTEFLLRFITAEDPAAPEFKIVMETFNVPQIRKFQEMMTTEFGIKV